MSARTAPPALNSPLHHSTSRSRPTAQDGSGVGSLEDSHAAESSALPDSSAKTDLDDDEDETKAGTETIERTLSQCLQPWLLPYLDKIDSIATETQKEFTSMMRELSFLVLKALYVVSIIAYDIISFPE
jgi:hypothetical protein